VTKKGTENSRANTESARECFTEVKDSFSFIARRGGPRPEGGGKKRRVTGGEGFKRDGLKTNKRVRKGKSSPLRFRPAEGRNRDGNGGKKYVKESAVDTANPVGERALK